MKYRKKPVIIEAVEVSEALRNARESWDFLPEWLVAAYKQGGAVFARDHILIKTREGIMRGDYHDWIIQGVQGELYPCKPDIFEATYDEVSE